MKPIHQQVEAAIPFARVELNMSRGEVLRQTPREWSALVKAWEAKQDREDRRIARICTVLAWCHGNSYATENNFMPKPVDRTGQSREDMIAAWDSINGQ